MRGRSLQVLETKGLDIVRRDWCVLSRNVGQQCLREILSGRDGDDIAAAVHDILRDVAARLAEGRIELKDFVITKQLTKRPEEYPDAGGQAHVQVTSMSVRCPGVGDNCFCVVPGGDFRCGVGCKIVPPPCVCGVSAGGSRA